MVNDLSAYAILKFGFCKYAKGIWDKDIGCTSDSSWKV